MNLKWNLKWNLLLAVLLVATAVFSFQAVQAASGKTIKAVTVKVGGKKANKKTISLKKGKTATIKVSTSPKLSKKTIRYQSSKPSVVSVSKNGRLKAKKAGTSTIRVTVQADGYKTKKVTFQVKVTNSGSASAENANSDSTGTESGDTESAKDAIVYMTTDISAEGMMAVYQALGWTPTGKVAVKFSTGEPPASNYLRPELIADVVKEVDGTIVECNTAYGGSRAQTAMHYQVAKDHGFTDIADFRILDEEGSISLPVTDGTRLTENYVGAAFADYDSYLVLSHFKGHTMAGFGGAIKNSSIGLGSSEGKCWIHSGGTSRTNAWGGEQDAFLEAMAEAGKAVSDYLDKGERIVYINVMNRLSVDCDCDGNPAEPDMHDIGILASTDPVALDQACIDLVYHAEDGESLVERIESRNGLHTLEHAAEIGLGSRRYTVVNLDD